MIYLDDRLPTHPKILRAGARLGPDGASRAFHLYVLAIGYARANLTDGYIPESFVLSCGAVSKSGLVGKVLAARGIGLWRKVHGGYVIHDYLDWNPKATEVKQKRAQDRKRKARERAGENGRRPLPVQRGHRSDSRARAVPLSPIPRDSGTSTNQLEEDPSRVLGTTIKNKPPRDARRSAPLKVLCAIARTTRPHPLDDAEWKERIKLTCARQGWSSPPSAVLAEALDRVEAVQRKGAA